MPQPVQRLAKHGRRIVRCEDHQGHSAAGCVKSKILGFQVRDEATSFQFREASADLVGFLHVGARHYDKHAPNRWPVGQLFSLPRRHLFRLLSRRYIEQGACRGESFSCYFLSSVITASYDFGIPGRARGPCQRRRKKHHAAPQVTPLAPQGASLSRFGPPPPEGAKTPENLSAGRGRGVRILRRNWMAGECRLPADPSPDSALTAETQRAQRIKKREEEGPAGMHRMSCNLEPDPIRYPVHPVHPC
jgi:hypothetical protein